MTRRYGCQDMVSPPFVATRMIRWHSPASLASVTSGRRKRPHHLSPSAPAPTVAPHRRTNTQQSQNTGPGKWPCTISLSIVLNGTTPNLESWFASWGLLANWI
jgi:hypothetical protein